MDYTDFVRAMQNEVREQMGPGMVVEVHTAIKNNGAIRTGLVLMQEGLNISPTIYLEEFYEQYCDGICMKDLAQKIQSLYEKVKANSSYPYENILSYRKLKNKIVFKLINKKENQELLRQIPYEEYLDLAVVFYAVLEHTSFGTATLLIHNSHLRIWKVSKTDVYEAAIMNTPRLMPMAIEQLTNYMYVVTNRYRNLGAAVMLYPDVWKKAVEKIGGSFYILPSSIHEVILIPENYGIGKIQLEVMVEEINDTEVDEEEILSDSVYYYNAKEGKVLM